MITAKVLVFETNQFSNGLMKPDLKKYLDVFQFLQDTYHFRKSLNALFSYAIWSSELGIKSKAYLRLVVLGERSINEKTREAIADNLELQGEAREYFGYLVAYSQAKNPSEKKVFGKKLMELLRIDSHQQDEINSYYEFLSNPLLPKLQTLLSFSDISKSPENLARLLMVDVATIESGLAMLEELQMIQKTSGGYATRAKSFKVKDQYKDRGLEMFYKNIFEESKAAIRLSPEERRFRSLFFAMSSEELSDFMRRLDEFAKEQLVKHDFDELANRRLFQFHLNFYPITSSAQAP